MALLITEDCTGCDACVGECPNKAIKAGATIYVIDPSRCTECVGAHDEPQCKIVCPADCIIGDPAHAESQDQLRKKFESLRN